MAGDDETIPLDLGDKNELWIKRWRALPPDERPPLLQFIQTFLQEDEVDELQAQQFEALQIGPDKQVQPRVFDALRDKLTLVTAKLALLRPYECRRHDYEDTHELLLVPCPDSDRFYARKLGILSADLIGKERPSAAVQRIGKGVHLKPGMVTQTMHIGDRHSQTLRNNEVGMLHVGYLNAAAAKIWQQPAGARWILPSEPPKDDMMSHHMAFVRDVAAYMWERQREMFC